jgi:hypothetical protein
MNQNVFIDCYLADTGLPEAQEDHAVRIVQFAYESFQRMTMIIKRILQDVLAVHH